jgi:hypothetical protein
MGKVALKILTLAAAAVAPHLIAVDSDATQVKRIEELTAEERVAMKNLSEKATCIGVDIETTQIDS